jgi:hypothetical protein
MKILDGNNNIILEEEYDLMMGELVDEKLFVAHHPAQEFIKEEGHYETIREFANGGKTVQWVVDVPGQEEVAAWDEYEDIKRLVPWSDAKKALFEIDILKDKLQSTDYNILKIVEGAARIEDMTEVIAQRAEWRKRINELQVLYNI